MRHLLCPVLITAAVTSTAENRPVEVLGPGRPRSNPQLAAVVEKRMVDPVHFVGITDFSRFERATGTEATVLTSPWLSSPRPWKELILSWNAVCPAGAWLKVEARATHAKVTTPFYTLGLWSADTNDYPRASVRGGNHETQEKPGMNQHSRQSVPGQKDEFAEVKTDTLVARQSMERVQVRLTLGRGEELPRLKFVGLCLDDPDTALPALPPNRWAWGRVIDVPQRSQLGHRDASGWCSPTCVSMILAYWSGVLRRPELDLGVPEVAKGVYDPNWPGTGNWPFNTALAGRFEGMRGYVTRLSDVAELEEWVAAGVPVAVSASFDLLNGRVADEGNGHLVIVTGFTATGDVVINDPWPDPKGVNSVRKTCPRTNLVRAWARSRHTVYLIYPESRNVPSSRRGHWSR